MSTVFSIFSFLFIYLFGHLDLVVGYVIAVVFPMPVISQFILNVWGKIWTTLKSMFPKAAADVTIVVNDVNSAVNSANISL